MHNLAGIKNFIQKNTRARNSRNIVEILWPCAALAQEITTYMLRTILWTSHRIAQKCKKRKEQEAIGISYFYKGD